MASPQEHPDHPGLPQDGNQGVSLKKSLGGVNDTGFLQDLAECLAEVEAEQKGEGRDEAEGRLRDWPSAAFTRPDAHHHATDSLGTTMDTLSSSSHDQKSTLEDSKTRSEAITLIRARTLTRSSPTESTFQGDMPGQTSSADSPLPPVNLAQYFEAPKKKKQKKKSKKSNSTKNSKSANDKEPGDKSDKPNSDQKNNISSPDSSKPIQDSNGTEVKLSNNAPAEPKTKAQDTTVPKAADAKSSVPEEPIFKKPEIPPAGSKKKKASQQPRDRVSNPPVPKTKAEVLQRQKPEQAPAKPVVPEKNTRANSNSTSTRSSSIVPSSQPASSHTPRRSSVHQKEKLSPIREVSPARTAPKDEDRLSPSHALHDSTAEDAQSLTCTPKSTSTTGLSAWAAFAQQSTPRTEISDTSEPRTKTPQTLTVNTQTANTPFIGPAPPPTTVTVTATTNTISTTHAHPSAPQGSAIPTPPTRTQKPDGYFWQLDSHGFPCAHANCDKRCNLWDGATVICPKCGPFSEVRYCSKAHLLEDIKAHWVYCGQMTFQHPCRETSIPRAIREDAVPLLPCLHRYDTPERHRQAVYFNMNAHAGDYFIFADWADYTDAGFPENTLNVRCSNRVVCAVSFDDPQEKDRFRRVLAACLFMTIEVHELIDYLYRLLRDQLRARTLTPPVDLETALQYQIHQEFAVTIQPQITGERHACETDWDGRNRRNCPDAVCRAEYRRLLGSLGGKGHRQLVDHLEGCYWILRAARTTHPTVKKAGDRMRGEGFEGVAEEDCREFCRGEGWDGYETGEMEIEGINA